MAMHDPDLPSGLAIDFGGTKIAAARVLNGEITKQLQVRTESDADITAQLQAITDLLDALDVCATDRIGLAVTGRVDARGFWYALNTETLPSIDKIPLKQLLCDRFGRDVNVQNDAAAAVIGEHIWGAGRGFSSLGFITVSTGVGGGFVINGTPLRSNNGLAGHVGFTTSRIARDRCGSGRLQTVESIASGNAIARIATEAGHGAPDAKRVYAAYLAGHSWAADIIGQSAEAIAELCANLKTLLDLEIVLLGGSIGLAENYLQLVDHYLQSEPALFRPQLTLATLGVQAAFLGVLCGGFDND